MTKDIYQFRARIRARTPDNAQAALEAVKREARNESLREAAILMRRGGLHTVNERADAILALMENQSDE